jgi:hypothetical protein
MATSPFFIVPIYWIIYLSNTIDSRSKAENYPLIASEIERSDTWKKDYFDLDAILWAFRLHLSLSSGKSYLYYLNA